MAICISKIGQLGFIIFCCFLLNCQTLYAASQAESYFDGYSIALGVEHKIMLMMIERKSDDAEAKFKQDVFAPSIRYKKVQIHPTRNYQ